MYIHMYVNLHIHGCAAIEIFVMLQGALMQRIHTLRRVGSGQGCGLLPDDTNVQRLHSLYFQRQSEMSD